MFTIDDTIKYDEEYSMAITIPSDTQAIDVVKMLRREKFGIYVKNIYTGELTPLVREADKIVWLTGKNVIAIKNEIDTFPYEVFGLIRKYNAIEVNFTKIRTDNKPTR